MTAAAADRPRCPVGRSPRRTENTLSPRSKLVLAAGLLLTAGPALATNGMRLPSFGAVQGSMGGASAAAPLDGATLISNPAGLSALDARLDASISYFKPSVDYQASESPLPAGFTGAVVAQPGKVLESQRGASPLPALAAVIPLSGGLTLGVGAFAVAGMGVDYAQNLYGGVTYSSYSQMRFAPGLAYRLTDWLSIGATANVMYANMGYDAPEGMLQVSHQAASAFGVGGTVGVQVQAMKGLTFGAAYESKSFFQDFKFNIPAHQPLDPSTGFPAVDQNGQPVILPASVDSIAFNQPSSFTAGLAWNAFEPLTLAGDVQLIRWSESNGLNLPAYNSDVRQTGAMPFNLNWNDQWVFKLGAQYRVSKLLALRAGYNYGKSPLDASRPFENIAFPAVAEHHITAGFGLDLSDRFSVALAGMYVPESKVTGSNPQQQFIASYQATMSQFAVDMSVGYRF